MSTPRRSAEILNHYLKLLFEAQGFTWSKDNQMDVIDLVKGLTSSGRSVPPAPPASIPRSAPRSYDTVNIKPNVNSPAGWLEGEE